MSSNPRTGQIDWLRTLLAWAVLTALALLFLVLKWSGAKGALVDLAVNVIPNLVAPLLIAIIFYFAFVRHGIAASPKLEKDVEEVKQTMLAISERDQRFDGVKDFYPNFRAVPWTGLIESARSIDIVVCYWDSWVKANWEPLRSFFRNGGSIRLFLPNPANDLGIGTVLERFPEYPKETLRLKIMNTGVKLREVLRDSQSRSARLEVNFYPGSLNYSAVRFDGESLLLSVYEQFRYEKIDSAAVLLDLTTSDHLRRFWDKEFGGFMQASKEQDLNELADEIARIRASGRETSKD